MKTILILLLMTTICYGALVEEYENGVLVCSYDTANIDGVINKTPGRDIYVDGVKIAVYNADEFIAWCMENVLTPELQPHYFALLSAANKDAKVGWDNFIAYCNMVGQSELGQTIINEAELRGANV
jgi:hypothetical protein